MNLKSIQHQTTLNPAWWHIGFTTIVLAAVLTRLWQIGSFPYAVFDEFYYATMATQYLSHIPFIDYHPPTARFIFTFLAWLGGADPYARFIGPFAPFEGFPYALMRTGSALGGIGLVIFIMLLAKEVTHSPFVGLISGFLAVFENSFVIFSRYIIGDIFLLTFGLAGLWCFWRKNREIWESWSWYVWLTLAGLLFGLSAGAKVSGGIFLACAWYMVYTTERAMRVKTRLIFLVALPIMTVLILILIHWLLLNPHGPVLNLIGGLEGKGKTVSFFDYVRDGNPLYSVSPLLGLISQRFFETFLAGMVAVAGHISTFYPHSVTSPWWAWPFLEVPMVFTIWPIEDGFAIIHLIGNPAIWWGGLLALAFFLWMRLKKGWFREGDVFLFGYACNLAVMAAVPRKLFLYHYLPSLVFLILITAMVLGWLWKRQRWIAIALLGIVMAGFFWFAPLTYGWPLTEQAILQRSWLPDWNPISEENKQRFPYVFPPSGS